MGYMIYRKEDGETAPLYWKEYSDVKEATATAEYATNYYQITTYVIDTEDNFVIKTCTPEEN